MNSDGEEDVDENMWTGREDTGRSKRSTDRLQNDYVHLYTSLDVIK
jgi:hypothetical protein